MEDAELLSQILIYFIQNHGNAERDRGRGNIKLPISFSVLFRASAVETQKEES